jgi:DNA-binding Lrp family transcriptional regulator
MDELLNILKTNARTSIDDIAKMIRAEPADVARPHRGLRTGGHHPRLPHADQRGHLAEERRTAVIEVKVQPEREGGFDRNARRISGFPEVVNM